MKIKTKHIRGFTLLEMLISMIKKQLLNPDTGAISRINKNTDFRKSTGKVLWSIWVAILGIIGKMVFWS